MRRRIIIGVILGGAVALWVRCAMPVAPGTEGSDHPFPTTASILPLQKGNRWIYRYTSFDSTGRQESLPDRDLQLGITRIYYLNEENRLVQVDRHDGYDSTRRYIYGYEWENLDSGYLVYHQGTGDVARRGLYIAGTFVDTQAVLYNTPRLWYAYPVGNINSWEIVLPGNDTASSVYECISKTEKAWFGRFIADDPAPLEFIDSCYLFRQTAGDDVYLHSFHPAHGKISMRYYREGVLRESYILLSEILLP